MDFIIEFNNGYKLLVSRVIDRGASRNYTSDEIVPRKYRERDLQESMVRDAFGNQIILTEKLVGCIIGMNNQKYTLPFSWVKPFNKDKVT